MTLQEAKEYITHFLTLSHPTHIEIEKFKQALKIVGTIHPPSN